MTPSKSAYSTGWSSTSTASRFSAGSGDGPCGTAQRLEHAVPLEPQVVVQPGGRSASAPRRDARPRPRSSVPNGSGVRSARALAAVLVEEAWPFLRARYHLGPMAARSIGSGTISFGLVSIPVKLFSASRVLGCHLLQHAARKCGGAAQAAVHLPQGQRRRAARRDGQGLRVRQGPVRHLHARRAQGAGGEVDAGDRDRRVRAHREGRSGLLRQGLLPRAGQGRGPRLRLLAEAMRRAGAPRWPGTPRAASSTWC